MSEQVTTSNTPQAKLISLITPLLEPMGYEVVTVEVLTHHQKTLRLFIDHLGSTSSTGTIGVEDCIKVTKALDEPLETMTEVDAIFNGTYELEVSSPGVDRPLRQPKDFQRFNGRQVRIHTFRPLNADELGNATYVEKNPKQKNFLGILSGMRDDKVALSIPLGTGIEKKSEKKDKARKAKSPTNSAEEVMIPLPLISKANLEPVFEFDDSK